MCFLATHLVFVFWFLIPLVAIAVLEPRLLLVRSLSTLMWVGLIWLLNACIHFAFKAFRLRGTGFKVGVEEVSARKLLLELKDQLYYIGLPEEFLTRGVMVGLAIPLIGTLEAVLFLSTMFGLVHFIHERRLSRFAETFITGAVYSLGLVFSGNVWVPAAAHVLVNLLFSCVKLSSNVSSDQ